jgi:hypothetical protein
LNVSSPTLTLGSALCSAAHPHVAASKTEIEVDMTRTYLKIVSCCRSAIKAE